MQATALPSSVYPPGAKRLPFHAVICMDVLLETCFMPDRTNPVRLRRHVVLPLQGRFFNGTGQKRTSDPVVGGDIPVVVRAWTEPPKSMPAESTLQFE